MRKGCIETGRGKDRRCAACTGKRMMSTEKDFVGCQSWGKMCIKPTSRRQKLHEKRFVFLASAVSEVSLAWCWLTYKNGQLWECLPYGSNRLSVWSFAGEPKCDFGWSYFQGSCYQLVQSERTWWQAVAHCVSLDVKAFSHLVNIHSHRENDFIWRLAPTTDLWIGYSNRWRWATWKWAWIYTSTSKLGTIDGSYSNWARGQPDNHGGNQKCALIWGWYKTPKWDDRECNAKKWFVCEKGTWQSAAIADVPLHHTTIPVWFFFFNFFCAFCIYVYSSNSELWVLQTDLTLHQPFSSCTGWTKRMNFAPAFLAIVSERETERERKRERVRERERKKERERAFHGDAWWVSETGSLHKTDEERGAQQRQCFSYRTFFAYTYAS